MINSFKFFHGPSKKMRVVWNRDLAQDLTDVYSIDAEAELTRLMSEEIARGIDEDILNRLINSVHDNEEVVTTRNVNVDYLQRYLEIGENRA